MPQPAFKVSPASRFFCKISSIESLIVPDTVQLMVEVAGFHASAPALEMTRPAGIAPFSSAQKNSFSQYALRLDSTSARVLATRFQVSATVSSRSLPSAFFKRYFLSHISSDAGCNAIDL